MSKTSNESVAEASADAVADFERQWWWFNPAHREHIHQFSAAWEILRRTNSYRLIHDRIKAFPLVDGPLGPLKLLTELRKMLPQSPPASRELREMVGRWQNMIVNGWTPEKTYLEARECSEVECLLPDGKRIRIPPTHAGINCGVPIILPRQVRSQGHTHVFVELCEICLTAGHAPRIEHLAGSKAPALTLRWMSNHAKPTPSGISGRFIAIEFPLHHPVEALDALLQTGLDVIDNAVIEGRQAWTREPDCTERRARPPKVVGTDKPLEAIALFPADEPRNLLERGFRTLIRPENIKKLMPRIGEEWIAWKAAELANAEAAELATYGHKLSPDNALEKADAAWEKAEQCGKLAPQSAVRPIKPAADLDNLACGDCAPFYGRNRSALPRVLPDRLRNDADLNKRIAAGRKLVGSQDETFIPLLNTPLVT